MKKEVRVLGLVGFLFSIITRQTDMFLLIMWHHWFLIRGKTCMPEQWEAQSLGPEVWQSFCVSKRVWSCDIRSLGYSPGLWNVFNEMNQNLWWKDSKHSVRTPKHTWGNQVYSLYLPLHIDNGLITNDNIDCSHFFILSSSIYSSIHNYVLSILCQENGHFYSI